jgi:mRNA interferase HigB
MRVVAKRPLREFWTKHKDAEHQLKSWYSEASKALWKSPKDIKNEYPKASIIADNRVVFNICGNKYRLVVKISYTRGWVLIRFIGTHKEYDIINSEKI